MKPLPRRVRLSVVPLEARDVPAATFTVNTLADVVSTTDGKLSLREAIAKANTTPGRDTIVLQTGTYPITRFGDDNTNDLGDYDVTESVAFVGKGPGATVIEHGDMTGIRNRLFDVHGPIDVTFEKLTLRKGGNTDSHGGAVQALAANLRFTDCRLADNLASKGGAVNAESGNVTLVRTTVEKNFSRFDGGGINLGTGTLELRDSRLTRNNAGFTDVAHGGGAIAAAVVLVRSTVHRNGATGAGGGLRSTSATLTDSTVSNNTAQGDGGGMYVFGGDARLTRSTLRGNSSDAGGGGGLAATTATLLRSSVADNRCALFGGGVSAVTVHLTDTTVRRNLAGDDGGGILALGTATVIGGSLTRNSADRVGGGLSAVTATVTGATIQANAAGVLGGGVFASEVAEVTDCVIRGNFAGGGGGLRANSATVSNSRVIGNFASEFGGGGVDGLDVSLTGCTVSNNSARIGGGGVNSARVELTDCVIEENFAGESGGGVQCSSATVARTTIRSNSAGFLGGGIRAGGVDVADSTISGNTAGDDGGGISAGTATLVNSTVSGNVARGDGGGIAAPSATLVNATIADNAARSGGGFYAHPGGGGTVRVHNTIIAQNLARLPGQGHDAVGSFTSQGNNLIGDPTASTGFTAGGDLVGTFAEPLDPKLGPLAGNGGPTQTHALLAGSPAIDTGDNTAVDPVEDQLLLKDQRGRPRRKIGIVGGDAVIDIGAVER
jgi:predicted outer membrane repeat protein